MAEQGHKNNIIIKRVKKIAAGAHGGSWKVAYADLVTAMMAFFLLMWLLNMVPQEKKAELAAYFNDFSIFSNPSPGSPSVLSGGLGPPGAVVGSQNERPDVAVDREGKEPAGGKGKDSGDQAKANAQAKALEQQVEQALDTAVPELEGQISVTRDQDKVRIEIMDKSDRPLFDRGSLTLLPDAQRILAAITDVVKKEGVKVAIEGHTDAYKYSGPYTNWDLSAGRALATRRLMVQYGLPPENVAQVTGFAETRPYVPGKPFDPKNRRISLLLFREPKPGDKPAEGSGKTGTGTTGKAGETIVPPTKTPDVGEVLEQQIDNLYDKSTEGQF
jgi:chemotaxis protein MotB